MTDKQLAIFLQKYLDKLNYMAKFTELHLNQISLADITSPQTAKIAIMALVDEIAEDLADDINVLSKK